MQSMKVMPLGFIAKSDEDKAVAGLWSEIWEDGTTSVSAALRMYMAELVPLITAGKVCCCLCCRISAGVPLDGLLSLLIAWFAHCSSQCT